MDDFPLMPLRQALHDLTEALEALREQATQLPPSDDRRALLHGLTRLEATLAVLVPPDLAAAAQAEARRYRSLIV